MSDHPSCRERLERLLSERILVLDGGRIAATGTHLELMRDSAIYAEIYSSQLQGERELMPELSEGEMQQLEREWAVAGEVA